MGPVPAALVHSSGVFFWVWTLIALGVTAIFSVILSARGLWSLQWGSPTANLERPVQSPPYQPPPTAR
jgi:hypothetical protein